MAPTTAQTLEIAQKAIKIFNEHGLECCLFGSTASYLYGVNRAPNDVDIVILTNLYDQETLKRMLVRGDSKFYLLSSKNRFASYKVLWYRTQAYASQFFDCKVDILIPGILNIPTVPRSRVPTLSIGQYELPVMPLVPQLLLKLQGWSDHRASHRSDMRTKQYVDVRDIDALLDIAVAKGAKIRAEDVDWMPESMITAAQGRLWSYTRSGSQKSATGWRQLGFVL